MEREFNLLYYMKFGVTDQRNMDAKMLGWHYDRLFEQRRLEKEESK
jgi:hypothetical protein